MRKSLFLINTCVLLLTISIANAQNTNVKGVLSADSLASGNLKDVLTSFFQLAFNNLTGKSKELNFNSNPYAVLLRANPSAAIDTNYMNYKILRKFNFGFGLKLDTSYHFNGFSSGIKYAIVNKRDTTTSRLLFRELGNDSLSIEIDTLQRYLNAFIRDTFENDIDNRIHYLVMVTQLFTDTTISFKQLDTTFQTMVKNVATKNNLNRFLRLVTSDPKVNVYKESQVAFKDLKKELQKKLLWTISISDTTYKDQFLFSNIVVRTEVLKGMGRSKPGSNWEYSIPATLNFLDDSLRGGRDLKRMVFSFEPGINLIIRNRETEHSFLELMFSGEYKHNFNQLYENEKRNVINFIGTFRVRVFADIWVPLQFRYDPDNGDVFGFINVKFNFNGQGKK